MDGLPPGIDPSITPAEIPPPGVVPNFIDPPSIAWFPRLCVYITLPLAIVFLVLRIYARLRISRQITPADYICLVAVASTATFCSFLLVLYHSDVYGRHHWDIPLAGMGLEFLRNQIIIACLYNISSVFIKLSLLVLYLHLFRVEYRAKLAIWLGAVVITVVYIALTVAHIVFNRPGDQGFLSTEYRSRAIKYTPTLSVISGIFGVVTDFYVLIIPLIMVSRLRLPLTRKLGVAGIFFTGLISCSSSIASAILRYRLLNTKPPDVTWTGTIAEAVAIVELNLGIVCCCMPVCFTLFKKLADRSKSKWMSWREYINSHWKKSMPSTSETTIVGTDTSRPNVSPQSTKPALMGLKSLLHKKSPDSQQERSQRDETNLSTYYELQSIDYDYHAQIGTVTSTNNSQYFNTRPQ